jgi:DNA-binding NtrC family response regulator
MAKNLTPAGLKYLGQSQYSDDLEVLNYTNGNKTKTAELLNIALTTLYRKLSEYGLE